LNAHRRNERNGRDGGEHWKDKKERRCLRKAHANALVANGLVECFQQWRTGYAADAPDQKRWRKYAHEQCDGVKFSAAHNRKYASGSKRDCKKQE